MVGDKSPTLLAFSSLCFLGCFSEGCAVLMSVRTRFATFHRGFWMSVCKLLITSRK
jgi:hypothetical protein